MQQTKKGYSLEETANVLRELAEEDITDFVPDYLKALAHDLEARHDHGDPCDDEACPCRKAEADEWRRHGAVKH